MAMNNIPCYVSTYHYGTACPQVAAPRHGG